MKTFKEFISEALIKTSGHLGSNAGGVYHDDDTNEKHYIKFPTNPEQAKTEVLGAKIQRLLGINNLKPKLKPVDGKIGVSTRWNDKLKPIKLNDVEKMTPDQHKQLGLGYASAVLLRNHDYVGTGTNYGQGNLSIDDKGKLHNVDQGASFRFRAQGGPKPYHDDVSEIHTLRDPTIAPEAAHVFNAAFHRTPEALQHGIEAVRNLDPEKVHKAFRSSGLPDWEILHNTFNKRKEAFLNYFDKN